MKVNHPNRIRNQSEGSNETRRKQSGDQHTLPTDEPALSPHRPDQLNRHDMQKALPEGAEPPDPITGR